MAEHRQRQRHAGPMARVALVAGAWAGLYWLNEHLWTWLCDRLGLDPAQRVPGAAHFFLYDTAKVLLLLVGMIFVIGVFRTTIRPEAVRAYLQGKPLVGALGLAALFGAITPFCSCSSIPLFIGFVAAGIPLSVTLTFLIAKREGRWASRPALLIRHASAVGSTPTVETTPPCAHLRTGVLLKADLGWSG